MNDLSYIEKLLKDSGKAEKISQAISGTDTQRLESMLDTAALSSALASGDVKSLENMLRQVLNTGEGRALAQKISGIMGK